MKVKHFFELVNSKKLDFAIVATKWHFDTVQNFKQIIVKLMRLNK
jgi:hypothetical protein